MLTCKSFYKGGKFHGNEQSKENVKYRVGKDQFLHWLSLTKKIAKANNGT